MMDRQTRCLVFGMATIVVLAGIPIPRAEAQAESLRITHGISSGEATSGSAVIWARSSSASTMVVAVDTDPAFSDPLYERADNSPRTDFTAQVKFEPLEPDTLYHYRVHFESASGTRSEAQEGSFETAPAKSVRKEVSLVVGGDLGGQSYCRKKGAGYAIFSKMEELSPDFFIANGDMIYADDECPANGPDGWQNVPGDFVSIRSAQVDWNDLAAVREVYLRHWRYNRSDPHFQSFLRSTPMFLQWDDHEVINDFGALWPLWSWEGERQGYPNLVRAGRETLFDFHPFDRHPEEPDRIYRSVRWGRDVELFLLDARSYRSANDLADTNQETKTVLGTPQLDWLKRGLQASDATWKLVSSDIPLAVPTGSRADIYGRDAFANGTVDDYSSRTGFERELLDLIRALDQANVRNLVFLTTDVHFAASLRYRVDLDGDGDFLVFYELICGPLNAGRAPTPARLDPTLGPAILYGEGNLFNFAHLRIAEEADGQVHLRARVIDETGTVRFGSELDLIAEE